MTTSTATDPRRIAGVVMYALVAFAAVDDTSDLDPFSGRGGTADTRRDGATAERADGR